MTLYHLPTQNFLEKELAATLIQGATASMTLNNVIGINNKPGVCIIDLYNANNEPLLNKREVVPFTGTSGSTLTGLIRGAAGTTDQDHAVGARVFFVPDVVWAQSFIDTFLEEHNENGTHKVAGLMGYDEWSISGKVTYSSKTTIKSKTVTASKTGMLFVICNIGWFGFDGSAIKANFGLDINSTTYHFVHDLNCPANLREAGPTLMATIPVIAGNDYNINITTTSSGYAYYIQDCSLVWINLPVSNDS